MAFFKGANCIERAHTVYGLNFIVYTFCIVSTFGSNKPFFFVAIFNLPVKITHFGASKSIFTILILYYCINS